jgi:hypothetical protein
MVISRNKARGRLDHVVQGRTARRACEELELPGMGQEARCRMSGDGVEGEIAFLKQVAAEVCPVALEFTP